MKQPFIVFLKNKTSVEFEYRFDVSDIKSTDNGYRVTFSNGKVYNYGADKVRLYPLISTRSKVRIYLNGILNHMYDTVDNYGHYLILRNERSCTKPLENSSNIEICEIKTNTAPITSTLGYFKEILKIAGEISFGVQTENTENKNSNQISTKILLKALENIDLFESRSALANYLDGKNPSVNKSDKPLIYPFGCNESQKQAVETALANSLSIVEGPPGTGKTQTILNIIANLIAQNKTVAIVSNNNSAVFNVLEKLNKYGYGAIVASLGNNENKKAFFDNLPEQKFDNDFKISKDRRITAYNELQSLDAILTKCFELVNKLAKLKTRVADAETEYNHIKNELPLSFEIKSELDNKFYRKWDSNKTLKLKDLLNNINTKNKLSVIKKLRLAFQYGFFDLRLIDNYKDELQTYTNHKFYELYIDNLKKEITEIDHWLKANDEKSNLDRFIAISKEVFQGELFKKYNGLGKEAFNIDNYKDQFEDFLKHYPVIISSTLSLHTSIPAGHLFDYLIIDEASQVDIIKSAVCFSCCRNAVIVGDSMQLSHIVDKGSRDAARELQKTFSIEPAYDYVEQNILSSLKTLYGNKLKSVLLKEHYRCHPEIIAYCNKKYYNNELIIMTSPGNNPFKIIETRISGSRDNYNQRQIDETNLYIREKYSADYTQVGVIAPYRQHVEMLQNQLPEGVEADTIHKFQGREKDAIIFNTVRNQIEEFIDNPNLINVCVSRAVKEFIVVKPESMDIPHGTNIGDLIRYICYTYNPEDIIMKGKVCSVFDLLYKEYNKALSGFLASSEHVKGSAAKIIIYRLITEKILLHNPKFISIDVVREYRLRDLIRDHQLFTEEEMIFIKNNSRLDFLLYNKIDKSPVLAIEVDGVSFHNNDLQKQRDNKKDHILEKLELPLLRLSTDGHNEETRITECLTKAMRHME